MKQGAPPGPSLGLPPGIGPGRPNRPGRTGFIILALVTLVAWAPAFSVLFTMAVAGARGCHVSEATVLPCPSPFGDLGELLTATGMMGWLMLATMPFMAATALAWAVLLLAWIWRRLRR